MFPFWLINASVTDAEGIRSRLVSFPLTLFSSVCHIAFPMVPFKKQVGSAFPVYLFTHPLLLFHFCFCQVCLVDKIYFSTFTNWPLDLSYILKCQTAQIGTVKEKTCLRRVIGFTSLLWQSLYSCFQVWLIISPLLTWVISLADHITAGYRKLYFFCYSWQPLLGRFWRLFSHPEIKLSATGLVLHCWEEHPDPNEVPVSSIKGPGCVSSPLT